jgi:hypothetical protein
MVSPTTTISSGKSKGRARRLRLAPRLWFSTLAMGWCSRCAPQTRSLGQPRHLARSASPIRIKLRMSLAYSPHPKPRSSGRERGFRRHQDAVSPLLPRREKGPGDAGKTRRGTRFVRMCCRQSPYLETYGRFAPHDLRIVASSVPVAPSFPVAVLVRACGGRLQARQPYGDTVPASGTLCALCSTFYARYGLDGTGLSGMTTGATRWSVFTFGVVWRGEAPSSGAWGRSRPQYSSVGSSVHKPLRHASDAWYTRQRAMIRRSSLWAASASRGMV